MEIDNEANIIENGEEILPEIDVDEDIYIDDTQEELSINRSSRLLRKQTVQSKKFCAKEERNATIKKVSLILQKAEDKHTEDDQSLLNKNKDIVKEVKSRWKKRDEAKRRVEEFEEPMDELEEKCKILAQAIAQSQHLVVYTGAGISTAARIPDYRGTNGIWTRLQQGKDIGNHDLSLAEPTFTHMALHELYKQNILKYVVSQNCDGLHLRSGLPKTAISEVHGNMYVEVCKTCKPAREYWRLFDVTENTARYSHKTMRKCYICNGSLIDTIVHFGERGSLQWPLNWSGASKNARKATTILCLGSSLKVLKKYPWLWQMHKPVKRRPNLYIVNLQWTPKDDCANVKINGKCDVIMKMVMEFLGITVPSYDRNEDPIFVHGTSLCKYEVHTTTQPFLKYSDESDVKPDIKCKIIARKCEKENTNEEQNIIKTDIKNEQIDLPINYCNRDLKTSIVTQCVSENNLKQSTDHKNCDTQSNIHNSKPSSTNSIVSLPIPKIMQNLQTAAVIPQNNVHNTFSIDSILQTTNSIEKTVSKNSNLLGSNLLYNQALLTYYQISNSILRNQFAYPYPDLIHYPFQTSLLYSGLHSIINPIPFLNEENNYIESNDVKVEIKEEVEIVDPSCEFCFENYKSTTCLFYDKYEPTFIKQNFRFSKIENIEKPLYCTCCDYTTEEEGDDKISDEDVSPDKICKVDEDMNEGGKNKIQPGWFGKGYRKNKKYKKKVTTY